ncbi:HDOD domain-containing protein [Spirochaeta cellobiosiphila]|uniref:HDOD domain-containing protein n=1 Tax=Spirochaeta cellobiosiphila TaxID=504483 RepID=UPI0004117002|nr:HDOD domain-containing protein [Spirochaeta cellobiosiphila]
MQGEQLKKALEGYITQMPALPTSVSKILEICNNPETSPSDLNKVISLDPVLMGRVLKLINSAYYGLNQEITSLVRAIIMLGINTVKNLALSTAILGTISGRNSNQAINMEGFWRHSLTVGVTAKLIAKKRGIDKKKLEEYFISGLLHDIGKIPLNNKAATEYIMTLSYSDRNNVSLHDAEEEVLNLNHQTIGVMVAQNWRLSDAIVDVIKNHHSYSNYSGNNKDILYTVVLSNYFANIMEIGFSGNRYPEKPSDVIYTHLGLTWNHLEDMDDIVEQEIEKAQIFLKLIS